MRKFFQFFLITSVAFFLVSCSQNEPADKEVALERKNEKQSFTLDFGHDMPVSSAQHIAAEKFAQLIKERTKGRMTINVFPNQELGTDQKMIEKARIGELAIIIPPTAKLTTLVPKLQFLDIPFMFDSKKILYEFLDGKLGKILLNSVRPIGLIGVTFWESGNKQFTANKNIKSPSDFKKLNVRTMKSPLLADQFQMMGANPILIDFHKIFDAMKDGVVSAGENSLASISALKLFEHQSHLILSDHAYLGQMVCFSEKILSQLPKEIQEVLISTAKELTVFQREEVAKKEKIILKEIADFGVQVTTLTPDQKKEFSRELRPLLEKYRTKFGTGFVEMALEFLNKGKSLDENSIFIGLDADLTGQGAISGLAIKRGMELAVDEINQNGGVLGKNIEIISRDHSGIGARGIENINFFGQVKNLVAVVGGLHSPVALAELDAIHANKIIYLDPWAAATHIVDNKFDPNYVFRVSVRDQNAGGFFVTQALLRNYKKIALLLENTGWGRSNETAILGALHEKKLNLPTVEWFNWEEENFKPQLNRIRDSGADVIILVANSNEGLRIINTMIEMSLSLPIISHWGITGGDFGKNFKRLTSKVDLMFLQTFSFINSNNKRTEELIKNYKEKYLVESAKDIVAPVGTAHAYDLVHMLAKAMTKSKSLDRPEIQKALETISTHKGLIKNYVNPFNPKNHDALDSNDFFLARYDSFGTIIPVTSKKK